MTEFYAQPYSLDHTGFYFNSLETYEEGMKKLNARGCEEVEIQFIDGEDHLADLAKNIQGFQNTVNFWFDEPDDLDDMQVTQIVALLDCGHSLSDALEVCPHNFEPGGREFESLRARHSQCSLITCEGLVHPDIMAC